jgi:hypothetical protein
MFTGFSVTLPRPGNMGNSPRTTSIHVLDDDSLLHVFHLYQPFLLGEDQDDNARLEGGRGWVGGRWWFKLAHVCQRWRNVILGKASYLGLSLVCTKGTPVADMLAHSPPLPLVIDYKFRDITPEDEEGIILALKQRNRIYRVRLQAPAASLQKFTMAIEEEYSILEYLIIKLLDTDQGTTLMFSETLQAPRLRHLLLVCFPFSIGCPLLTTAAGLVRLRLTIDHPSTYFHPNALLQWVSLMPQLEMLSVYFKFSIPNRDVERQLAHMPIIAPVTLPNLRHFEFCGVSSYLETVVHRLTTPRLNKLQITFFNQLTFSVPCLLQFIETAENLSFETFDTASLSSIRWFLQWCIPIGRTGSIPLT